MTTRHRWLALTLLALGCTEPSSLEPPVARTEQTQPVLFLIGGQSNARGRYGFSTPEDLAADLGTLDGGAWPVFAQEYMNLTGTTAVYASNKRLGGTRQGFGGPTNWSREGTMLPWAFLGWDSAQARIPEARIGAVLWVQGETDAGRIDEGKETKNEYQSELAYMILRIQAKYPGAPFLIFRTGMLATGDTPGWTAVRNAQTRVADNKPGVWIGYGDAYTFPARGMMDGDIHYSLAGYEEMGLHGARSLVAGEP